jgi:hypothetical protein
MALQPYEAAKQYVYVSKLPKESLPVFLGIAQKVKNSLIKKNAYRAKKGGEVRKYGASAPLDAITKEKKKILILKYTPHRKIQNSGSIIKPTMRLLKKYYTNGLQI